MSHRPIWSASGFRHYPPHEHSSSILLPGTAALEHELMPLFGSPLLLLLDGDDAKLEAEVEVEASAVVLAVAVAVELEVVEVEVWWWASR